MSEAKVVEIKKSSKLSQNAVLSSPIASDEESATASTSLSFSVLLTALLLREKNGLRHNDYHRYRCFCSRKLFRLRSSLNFKHGRNRYLQKSFPAQVNDIRYLTIVLVCAERAWSFGMQLKADNATAQIYSPRARRHAIRKFTKAVKYAEILRDLCFQSCDKKTCIDAKSYSDWLKGVMLIEKERWIQAATNLKDSFNAFSQLKRISVSQTVEHLRFSNQLEEIQMALRLCRYHLEKNGVDCSEFMQLGEPLEISLQNPHTLMAVSVNKDDTIFTYRGVKFQPPSEKIGRMLKGLVMLIDQKYVKIEKSDTSQKISSDVTPNIVIEGYGEVSNLTKEILKEIHSEMIHSEASDLKAAWTATEGFTVDLLNCTDIERNAVLEILFLQKIKNSSDDTTSSRIRYDEGVRYTDLIKQSIQQQIDSKMLSSEVEALFLQILKVLKIARAVCLSFYHAMLQKYVEAFVMSQWIVSLEENDLPTNLFEASNPYRRIGDIFRILQEAVFFHANRLKCINLANAVLADRDEVEKQNLDSNTIELIENLILKSEKFPPKMEAISCKPLLIDLALFDLPEPNLSARIPQKATGLINRLKSIWKF